MNKSVLAAFAVASILSACSSHPSDFRPGNKVSVDAVAPGTRETDIYNLNGQGTASHEGHDTGAEAIDHPAAGHDEHRPDVMPNHDEHKNDIGGNDQVPAEEKTTDDKHVENHE